MQKLVVARPAEFFSKFFEPQLQAIGRKLDQLALESEDQKLPAVFDMAKNYYDSFAADPRSKREHFTWDFPFDWTKRCKGMVVKPEDGDTACPSPEPSDIDEETPTDEPAE